MTILPVRAGPNRLPVMRALLGVSLVGLVLHAVHTTTGAGGAGLDGFFNDWLYNAVVLAAACACLVRAALVPGERGAWLAIGGGLLSWSIGEIYWTLRLSGLDEIPYPSVADGFYLATYPALYIGIGLLVRARLSRFHASLWLDGIIGALAVAAIGAALLYPAFQAGSSGDTATVAVNLAYPLGDLLLLGFVVGVLALTGWRPGRAWVFLAAGLAVTALADGTYLYREATGSYAEGTVLDSSWLLGSFLIACSASCVRSRPVVTRLEGLRVLMMPCLFALAVVTLEVYSRFHPISDLATGLATATLVAVIARMAITFHENLRLLSVSRQEALTDSLTDLGNRRRLMLDLAVVTNQASGEDEYEACVFAFFDLDGFKAYNDSFGHPAGDALLTRLSQNLVAAVQPRGKAYRLGGDEFCVIVPIGDRRVNSIVAAASAALTEEEDAFSVSNSRGVVVLPREASDAVTALRLADRRLYSQKSRRPRSPEWQTRNVLLRVLREREPALGDHLEGVARLSVALGQALELEAEELDVVARAAELHDVGKMAIPDDVLAKPGPLTDVEWALIRRHTLTGERILAAAPAMAPVARVVRATHERWDGSGYPDRLAAEAIPLGARVIAVCDAYEAMIEQRPWRAPKSPEQAVAELRRCAGTQFDPRLVHLFCDQVQPLFADRAASGEPGVDVGVDVGVDAAVPAAKPHL